MRLLNPEWLLLFIPILAIGWMAPRRTISPLRFACLVVAILALCRPLAMIHDDSVDVWLLADRSASINHQVTQNLPEWESILRKTKRAKDNLYLLDFADVAHVRGEGDPSYFEGARPQTRLALAAKFALSRRDPTRNNRLLLLSDGYSTDSLDDLAESLIAANVPLDFRLVNPSSDQDYRVVDLRAPPRVRTREPFLLELTIQGNRDGVVHLEIVRNDEVLQSKQVQVINGYAIERFTDTIVENKGAIRYEARINAAQDGQPGNNSQAIWVEPLDKQRLVVFTGYDADPLPSQLRSMGFAVQSVSINEHKSADSLVNAQAIILNNIGAASIPHRLLSAIQFYVEEQGGGLIMLGGQQSFGSGGYFDSPVDSLLPVSLELRDEHRRNRSAIAIVLDRSGSMSAGVAGNLGNMTKMDLANEGAARAADIMGANDELTVFAVDSSPHLVVPLQKLGDDRGNVLALIRSINGTGGGIYTYVGLEAGWEAIKPAEATQKHIILFADANDAEEPGAYKELLKELTDRTATVSVIGLGRDTDVDSEFLKDVALRGNGRIFFVDNAVDLPGVFSQEVVTVSRSTFVKELTPLVGTPRWAEIAPKELSWLPAVDGYNLTYARPGSSVVASTVDQYKAPLVAFWQRGQGKTAVVTFPVNGSHSEKVRAWTNLPTLVGTLASYVSRPTLPPGLLLRNQLSGSVLRTEVYFDQQWETEIARSYPRLKIFAEGEEIEERAWDKLKPGLVSATIEIPSGKLVRGSVQIGTHSLPFGPMMADSGIEWRQPLQARRQLLDAAKLSGGEERLDLSKVWNATRGEVALDIRPHLLTLLLGLFLSEVLLSRLNRKFWPQLATSITAGLRLPVQALQWPRRWQIRWQFNPVRLLGIKKRKKSSVAGPDSDSGYTDQPNSGQSASEENTTASKRENEELKRRSRFSRAKRRGLE